ncbi:MAG: Gfo/Idh/MocA family oxidoreductase [Spirochaetaceae bacterium]|jgi:predicted dehydrogenase|nr:Gfo/Idh/MocA family oxidoreductase [Spirochaetaceae bacterium]
MEKLRMGVLGCSLHYSLRIAASLRESLLADSYAVASRDAAKAQKYAETWGFSKSYGSYDALLADPQVDFVYCPLPNHLHLEYIKKSADAGKPILCEKPIGLNAGQAVEAAEYCQKKNVPLMEAFMYRFHPQWLIARDIVRSGELGTVLSTNGIFSYNLKDPANIRNIREAGGGGILDIGCYTVSSARFLMGGEPERVLASYTRDPVFKTDILTSALLDFGDGRVSTFTIGTQFFPYQRVTALGTGGSLSIQVPFNMFADIPGRVTVNTDLGERVIKTEIVSQYLLEFDAFAGALIGKTAVPTPPADAIANMAVLDALFASGESEKWEQVKRYD